MTAPAPPETLIIVPDAYEPIGYAAMDERPGLAGLLDKFAVMDAAASKHGEFNEPFRRIVLEVIRTAGNTADGIMRCWEAFCCGLPYRREPGEIVQAADVAAWLGGDCDDLAIVFCAGMRSQMIPCALQILTDAAGNGFHIRCLVGLPPLDPDAWIVVDPVVESEAQWCMANRSGQDAAPKLSGQLSIVYTTPPWILGLPQATPPPSTTTWLLPAVLGVGLGLLAASWLSSAKTPRQRLLERAAAGQT